MGVYINANMKLVNVIYTALSLSLNYSFVDMKAIYNVLRYSLHANKTLRVSHLYECDGPWV